MADPRDPDYEEEILPDEVGDEGSDAGSVDDESGDEAQAGQEPQEFETQERVSRRDQRIREELRAEREHRARVEAELQLLRQEREQRQPVQQGETEEQFQYRLSQMDPETRMEARLQRSEQRHNYQLALATFAAADRADKAAFDSRTATSSDPLRKKLAGQVEQVLAIERRKGRDFDRETVFNYLVGATREERLRSGKPSPAQQRGRENIQRQSTRPSSGGRGDQSRQDRPRRYAPGDMSPEAVRQRLEAPDAFI